jgi:hypothetical protein
MVASSLQVELGKAYNCSSPQTFYWMLPGAWELAVVGTDPAGNEAAPQAYPWTVAYQAGALYTRFLR